MDLVIHNGLTKKDIPYEAQIIRVADEYDAIVSKRQYKTHIGISDTLKILIENTKPHQQSSKSGLFSIMPQYKPKGKNNPIIVKALFKVVIDDIEYEIFSISKYLDSLKSELKRFDLIEQYANKMEKSMNQKTKNYYLEGIQSLLINDETLENYKFRHEEYKKAYKTRKANIDNLYNEIKIIKKLKV